MRERKGQRCIIQRYTRRRKQDISLISILLRRYKSRGTRPRDSLRALVFLFLLFFLFFLSLFLSPSPSTVFSPFATYHTVFRTFMLSLLHWGQSCSRVVRENRESIVSTLELTNSSRIAQPNVNTALNSFEIVSTRRCREV